MCSRLDPRGHAAKPIDRNTRKIDETIDLNLVLEDHGLGVHSRPRTEALTAQFCKRHDEAVVTPPAYLERHSKQVDVIAGMESRPRIYLDAIRYEVLGVISPRPGKLSIVD